MSFETLVFGYIEGATGSTEDYRVLQRANTDCLDRLPEMDDYPSICRGMFSSPLPEPNQGTHRAQVIHYGASYRNMDYDIAGDDGALDFSFWTDKFEKILASLYWVEARVLFLTEVVGHHTLQWKVDPEAVSRFHTNPPQPPQKWFRRHSQDPKPYEGGSGWVEVVV